MQKEVPSNKACLAGLLILLYLAIAVIMPLSDIHLEYLGDATDFVTARTTPRGGDLYVLLHELLFSHFGKKSQLPARAIDGGRLASKHGQQTVHARYHQSTACTMDISSISRPAFRNAGDSLLSARPLVSAGFHPLRSGLSPPSV